MASKVELLWHDAIYWIGSQPTHATAIAVAEIISAAAAGDGGPVYRVGLAKDAHRELAAYCDLLIRGLHRLDEVFRLGLGPIVADLKSEYVSLFQGTLDQDQNP